MSFLGWVALFGAVLLTMALSSAWRRRLPVSTAIVYLAVGVAIGPLGADWVRLDGVALAPLGERCTEIAVLVSLFVGGLKLRLSPFDKAWRAAYVMAGPVMLVSICGAAAFAHLVLGLPLWTALLLGAILAPTDPVLASAISVDSAADHDRLRVGLSGEAGLNDGMAFPFVMFGLLWAEHDGAGAWIGGWALHRLLWAVPAGLAIGFVLGTFIGRLAIAVRSRYRDLEAPSDLFALALVLLAYVLAEVASAWGFLAAFTAGLGLRHAELQVVREQPHPDAGAGEHPPAEDLVAPTTAREDLAEPAVAAGVLVSESLSFGDTVERVLEVLLVVAVGVLLAEHWTFAAVPLALVLFVVVRPAASLLLVVTPTTWRQRALSGWFGIRGVGSLYYLAYALQHGAGDQGRPLTDLTLSVVAVSIFLHGVTAQPLVRWYERSLKAART